MITDLGCSYIGMPRNNRRRFIQVLSAGVGVALRDVPGLLAQTPPNTAALPHLPTYLIQSSLHSLAREFLVALGDRLQVSGKERLTLVGQYIAGSSTVPAQLTWEAPGNFRFDRTGSGFTALVYNTSSGVINPSSISSSDQNVMESLLDDSPESFLYGFFGGNVNRLLGGRFRTDNGKTRNYTGPWNDIYETTEPVKALNRSLTRRKFYCFDSQTKLMTRAAYQLSTGPSGTVISTQYSNWTTQNGEAIVGQIVRTTGGSVTFTFKVNSATVSPAAADGTFSHQ